MRILGLDIKRLPKPVKKLQQIDGRGGGWINVIRESFPGAFQHNVTLEVPNITSFGAVYACTTLIASDIAKMRIRLVQMDGDGIWQETENPAYSPVLRKPNHYQTRIEFISRWVLSKLLYGNAYILKERDTRGVVTAMYVLNPQWVKVLVTQQGDVYYEVNKDELSSQYSENATIPARNIIHDKMNTLFHPLVGVSPIFACGLAAVQGMRIQNNSAGFFANGARPSGVLSAPDEIGDETAARLKTYWEEQFNGQNAGKIAVLGDGLKYEPMMMTSADAQVIEQLRWTSENVCSAFHVPAHMIGVGPTESNNNVETRLQMYYSQCLQIHVESIELLLDEALGLAPATDASRPLGTEFDLDALLRMDTASLIKAEAEAVGAGIKTPNEARYRLGLPPISGGESAYLQQQNFSLEALAKRDAQDDPFAPATTPAAEAPIALPAPDPKPADEARQITDMVTALRESMPREIDPSEIVEGVVERVSTPFDCFSSQLEDMRQKYAEREAARLEADALAREALEAARSETERLASAIEETNSIEAARLAREAAEAAERLAAEQADAEDKSESQKLAEALRLKFLEEVDGA